MVSILGENGPNMETNSELRGEEREFLSCCASVESCVDKFSVFDLESLPPPPKACRRRSEKAKNNSRCDLRC